MEKSRAIELLEHLAWDRDIDRNPYGDALNMAIDALKAQLSQEGTTSELSPAQPELTDEQAITHLQSSGWMQRHDKEMYESGLREQLADDSDSYDSLLPNVQSDLIEKIQVGITATNSNDAYSLGMRNGMRWCKSLIDGAEPKFEDVTDSAELLSTQPEQPWILCDEKMPEEHEWIGTKEFGTTISDEVYVTFENEKGERFCNHMTFQNGELSRYDKAFMDAWHKGSKPIAWMPLPEPYKPNNK